MKNKCGNTNKATEEEKTNILLYCKLWAKTPCAFQNYSKTRSRNRGLNLFANRLAAYFFFTVLKSIKDN